ncbi:RdRP-domain-containing protein [Wilcoxina mikolae CBS 423.85]|nr:RdRP-domain-containing protein [Wilcoxina mikolae CBS 423.85]
MATALTPPRRWRLYPNLPALPTLSWSDISPRSVVNPSETDNQVRDGFVLLPGEKRRRGSLDGDSDYRYGSRARTGQSRASPSSSPVPAADTKRSKSTVSYREKPSGQQEGEGSKPVGIPVVKHGEDTDVSDNEDYYEVEEYQAIEQAGVELLAEGASLQDDIPLEQEDDYDLTSSLELGVEEFDLDIVTGSRPMPYETFSFFIQHEITRISLALELTPEKLSTQVPAVAERFGNGLHSARTRGKLWKILDALGKELSNSNKALPPPPTEEVWSAVKDSKPWPDNIGLSGVAYFNEDSPNSGPSILLNPPALLRKMDKFTHSFGSDRFLRLRIPFPNFGASEAFSSEIARWLAEEELILMGRRWRCFWTKYGSRKRNKKQQPRPGACKQWVQAEYYLVAHFFAERRIGLGETSTDVQFIEETSRSTIRREMGREDLIRWHMPIDKHMGDSFAKMWSRISLGLSESIPTVTFQPNQIKDIGDILSPTGIEMNDGCSTCTPEAMRMICAKLNLDEMPAAVQGRIGGAKGMWFVDPKADRFSKDVAIFVTKSQRKFLRHDVETESDWARSTLFVLGYSKEPSEADLNFQLVPLLFMQGVPYEIFKEILEQHIDQEIGELMEATRDKVTLRTWLSGKRVASNRKTHGEIARFISGTPNSIEEQMTMLLDAGFEPTRCSILMDGLVKVMHQQCKDVQQSLHIRVPYSTYVYCIADPTGTLEEGEVSLQFSKGPLDPATKTRWDCLECEVLVARIPAHLPTDIQKVRAVCPSNESGLRRLKDVIVFSTKGNFPLAGMLSGGDYDGDKPWVCWDPRLVVPFKNNPSFAAFQKFDTKKFFDNKNRPLHDLPDIDTNMTSFFRLGFELDLQKDYLGICTNILAKYSCDRRRDGIDSNMKLFAQLCGIFVDAPKQGLQPKKETVVLLDGWNRKLRKPAYKTPEIKGNVNDDSYILDRLVLQVAWDAVDKKREQFAKVKNDKTWNSDKHLTEQFNRLDTAAYNDPPLRQMLTNLDKSLQSVRQAWAVAVTKHNFKNFSAAIEAVFPIYKNIKPEPCDDPRIRAWHDYADCPGSEWNLIKASKLFHMIQGAPLPWYMAMPELCAMKARESSIDLPAPRSVVHDVYFVLKPNSRLLKDKLKEDDDMDIDD